MGAYSAAVLADSPTHYWRFADPEGNIANDIGSLLPFPLWVIQGTGHTPMGYSGPNSDGGSSVWDATNWVETLANLPFASPISIDWVLWVLGVDGGAVQRFPWGWGDGGNGPFHNELGSGIYALNFGSGAVVPAAPPTAQRWHHFAFTYANGAGTFSYYVDGTLQGSGASGVVANFSSHLTVGRRNAAGSQWVGALAEFAIYPSVLSSARVAAHAAALSSTTAPPVAGASGGLTGAVGNSVDTSLLQKILQSVRQVY